MKRVPLIFFSATIAVVGTSFGTTPKVLVSCPNPPIANVSKVEVIENGAPGALAIRVGYSNGASDKLIPITNSEVHSMHNLVDSDHDFQRFGLEIAAGASEPNKSQFIRFDGTKYVVDSIFTNPGTFESGSEGTTDCTGDRIP